MSICPFHDLAPSQVVYIDIGGIVLPMSAELACGRWHVCELTRIPPDTVRAFWDGYDKWFPSSTPLAKAFGGPQSR